MADIDPPQGYQMFAAHLRKRDARQLQDQAKQVEALQAMPGWQVLMDLLGWAEENTLNQAVYNSGAQPYEVLTDALGAVRGLRGLDLAVRALRYVAQHEEQKLRDQAEEESRGSQ